MKPTGSLFMDFVLSNFNEVDLQIFRFRRKKYDNHLKKFHLKTLKAAYMSEALSLTQS